jgi:hypothetical protein
MHPLLISLANINAGVRMKATSHVFALAAYLSIPKFLDVNAHLQSLLAVRVFHICLSIVTKNLKCAEFSGKQMPDPWGNQRIAHMPLVRYIADLPEQCMISCVLGSESPTSTASQDQFGDGICHPRCTQNYTLNRITLACQEADPTFLPAFLKACHPMGLNGVNQPFWKDWGSADPSLFLTPDALHAWHKFYFDHLLKWVINMLGGDELDWCMAAIQPWVGARHWPKGISKLKQCTGREHRDLEKILVPVASV